MKDAIRGGRADDTDIAAEQPLKMTDSYAAKEGLAASTLDQSVDQTIAADIQQKGTEYLVALGNLAQLSDSARVSDPGREVALNSLYAAADETVRLFPENGIASRILDALEPEDTAVESNRPQKKAKEKPQKQIIWF
jgi:hypothetical protein